MKSRALLRQNESSGAPYDGPEIFHNPPKFCDLPWFSEIRAGLSAGSLAWPSTCLLSLGASPTSRRGSVDENQLVDEVWCDCHDRGPALGRFRICTVGLNR